MKTGINNNQPPRWAVRFFRWYCNDHLAEAALGDFEELYERRISTVGKGKADLLFIWNVIQFLQPFALRRKTNTSSNAISMLENYFKIAWRTMLRQKMYSTIKVIGFAIGLAACMLIFLFIQNEVSYDRQYAAKPVYRIYNDFNNKGAAERWAALPPSVVQILKNDIPEIEHAARLIPQKWFNAGDNLVRIDGQTENFYEEGFAYADNDLLEILDIPMLYGDKKHALEKPNSIIINKSTADKYFSGIDPVGKIIVLNDDNTVPFVIGGVMNDFPSRSSIHFKFLITLTGKEFWPGEQTDWCCWNYDTYVTLRNHAEPTVVEKKLTSIRDTYLIPYLEKNGDQSVSDIRQFHTFGLQPVQNIYLNAEQVSDNLDHGDLRFVWLFGGIALFILLLAAINFINLTTAKSANRAKEVGLRKTVGSGRGYLIRQFLTESTLYSFISFVIALIIVSLSLPFFNVISGKQLFIPWTSWWWSATLITGSVVIGLLAGLYPSFYLSSFKPVDVLKGSASLGMRSSGLRSGMVVFQFTTSIALIIGTFVVSRQMDFILTTKIGFDKGHVMIIEGANTLKDQRQTFKDEVLKLSSVENATISDYLPVSGTNRDQNSFWKEGKTKEDKAVYGQRWYVDADYIPTLGMNMLAGRNFDVKLASDSQALIMNKAMINDLGLSDPIGQRITTGGGTFTIIGVVEDFNYESMKGKIRPLAFIPSRQGSVVAVKIQSAGVGDAIESLSSVCKKFRPNQPFRYSFLDDRYARMYADVERTGNIFTGFATLAIVVACLGLFALSAFMVEQRGKEISIRLVLGASVSNIFTMLTKNFISLVVVSFVIATPLAWFVMNEWLKEYAYKIDITWDVFLIAGAVSVFIALMTVSYQSIRAALVNPVGQLRGS